MPEPVNIDLTARVAAEERGRRADLASGERSIDILVIDDQPDHEAGWFARHLPGHRRLSLESVSELERFLAGQRLPNLPQPPYQPELAILDLSLGAGQRDGLQALHALRLNPATRDLPATPHTNGLDDHRDLLAVLAAQLNRRALPPAPQSSTDRPFGGGPLRVRARVALTAARGGGGRPAARGTRSRPLSAARAGCAQVPGDPRDRARRARPVLPRRAPPGRGVRSPFSARPCTGTPRFC